jgi:PelA/Pel-15E family pectate lyase
MSIKHLAANRSTKRFKPGPSSASIHQAGALILLLLGVCPVLGAIIGTNSPAQPLTLERIAALPSEQQAAWRQYLDQSSKQLQADHAFLREEMARYGMKTSIAPPQGRTARGLLLDEAAPWYSGPEGTRLAKIVLSFQTPAGGWSKNLDMTSHTRAHGEHFAAGNISRFLSPADNDAPAADWNYVGTFDNDATTTQLRFLARVITASRPETGAEYRSAFQRGLEYIFGSQYPNGGWPQVWPLQGGYHDAITYNDGAMVHVLSVLRDIVDSTNQFAFLTSATRERARASLARGVQCILSSQISVGTRKTVWCQQHDVLTLQPTSARNYEMPAQSTGESAEIMILLMREREPTAEIATAIHSAAAWLQKVGIRDVAFTGSRTEGRRLVAEPGRGPLWARFYEIGTDRPIFGDRDKTIQDDVNQISRERRNGYSWYSEGPASALKQYSVWRNKHG